MAPISPVIQGFRSIAANQAPKSMIFAVGPMSARMRVTRVYVVTGTSSQQLEQTASTLKVSHIVVTRMWTLHLVTGMKVARVSVL